MYVLTCFVTVGKFSWDFTVDIEVESSWEMFTDTATLTLPRKIKMEGKPIIESSASLFSPEDPVAIQLGYDGRLETVFRGVLVRIENQNPIKLKCEDHMWLLKRSSLKFTKTKPKLSDVVATITTGVAMISPPFAAANPLLSGLQLPATIPQQVIDAQLGTFRVSKVNGVQVLKKIKEKYRFHSWFRDGVLYVGPPAIMSAEYRKVHELHFQKNIVADDLTYRRADEIKLKVKAISIMPDNKKFEIEIGDADGAERTLHFYNVEKQNLKTSAEAELARMKVDGYSGTLTTLGEPFIRHGDAVTLTDDEYPERGGTYLVKKVVYTFGTNGYRQKLTLDQRIS